MLQGYAGTQIPISVNFLRSRSGLSTVGFTVVDRNLAVVRPRSTLTNEIQVGSAGTGMYTASLLFTEPFSGFVIWDTGQLAGGVEPNRLRIAQEEILILAETSGANVVTALNTLSDAVGALYDENVMKIPNAAVPSQMRVVRKRPDDLDWSNPLSDSVVPIDMREGRLRYGGPPLS